jgi:serine/threonine-protein kinase
VNPSNIFLTYGGEVKLFDFGLAKAVGRKTKSSAGIVKGKLPYLSPEQVMQFPFDRRADIFALGTTLWEMVTMQRLFRRDDDVETVKAVRTFPVPDPRKLLKNFPPELAAIIAKALERNREHRYATAAELARDLDAFVPEAARAEMPGIIEKILDTLFAGERAKQMGWLKRTQSPTTPRMTLPPPAPVPMVAKNPESLAPPPPSLNPPSMGSPASVAPRPSVLPPRPSAPPRPPLPSAPPPSQPTVRDYSLERDVADRHAGDREAVAPPAPKLPKMTPPPLPKMTPPPMPKVTPPPMQKVDPPPRSTTPNPSASKRTKPPPPTPSKLKRG